MSWILSVLIGLFSGALAAMGLGGGFVLIAALAFLTDLSQQSAQGVNLFFFLPITLFAMILHIKNRLIDVKTALLCALFGIPFAIGGYFLSGLLPSGALRKCFAVFVIAAGLTDLVGKKKSDKVYCADRMHTFI